MDTRTVGKRVWIKVKSPLIRRIQLMDIYCEAERETGAVSTS